jgi:hypothetical protein
LHTELGTERSSIASCYAPTTSNADEDYLYVLRLVEDVGGKVAFENAPQRPAQPVAPIAASTDDPVEKRLADARQKWRAGFARRVSAMERLLARSSGGDVPTPLGDGDE